MRTKLICGHNDIQNVEGMCWFSKEAVLDSPPGSMSSLGQGR